MKLKNPDNEKYIKSGLTAFCVVAAGLALFFILHRSSAVARGLSAVVNILKPFIYGAVIAYLLTPFVNKFRRFFLRRFGEKREKLAEALSIALAMVIALLIISALVVLVIPQLVSSVDMLSKTMPGKIEETAAKAQDLFDNSKELQSLWDEYGQTLTDKAENWMKNDLPALGQRLLGNAATAVTRLGTTLKNLVLGVLISLYILASRRRFAAQAKLLLYAGLSSSRARVVEKEVRYADKMFNGFLMGKIIDSAIIGVLCFIGCMVMRFDSAALISVIVGVTNIIPFFGPFIGAIPCALMLLIQNPLHALYFVIFVVVLQQLDGNVIGPKILGDSTGLSSFWVLFSILLFGGLWLAVRLISLYVRGVKWVAGELLGKKVAAYE